MAQAQIIITAITAQAKEAIDRLNRSLDNVESSTKKAGKGLNDLSSTAKLAAGAFAALTAGYGVAEIVDITGRYTDLNSRLINATGSADLAAAAFEGIKKSARTTYQPLEQTAEVFLRNSVALNELGYTTNEQIKVSTALGNAMAVSGAKGQRAASALDGFQKAIAGGTMQGEDFNRIMDNAPQLIEAMAKSLGVTTQQFREMVKEGKITSDVMIPALVEQFDALEKKASEMPATIGDAFTLLNNSLFEFIGKTDDALGISETLAGVLIYLSDNIHIVIGALAGIALGVLGLTIKMMGLAAAIAFATGGLSLLATGAIGAGIAVMAKEMGLFSSMAKEAVDPLKEQTTALENAAAAEKRKADAARKALEAQQKGLKDLFAKIKLEGDSIGLSEQDLAIKKNIAEAAKILKVEEGKLLASVRARIVEDTKGLIQKKQAAALDKVITDLEQEKLNISTQDKNQREITVAIRKQELEFGRSLNVNERERLTTAIQQNQQSRDHQAIIKTLEGLETQRLGLAIQDKVQREIVLTIRKQEQDIGRELIDSEKEKIVELIKQTAELEKQNKLRERTRTIADEIVNNSIIGALKEQKALDGVMADIEKRYEKEVNFKINSNGVIYDLQSLFEAEIAALKTDNANAVDKKIRAIEERRISDSLAANKSGIAKQLSDLDRYVLQRAGDEERLTQIVSDRINFEKKSGEEKLAFGIDQGAQLFSALGAQNKKAFEAAKAFNIANAIMNTYMAATKALATYPPPFNFIAAAAAVGLGLAQVAQIRAQTYSGRQLGGPVMGGTPYLVGESGPELFTPNTTGSITRNSDLGGSVTNVNFTIQTNDAAGFDDLLLQRRGMITQMISDATTERGSRSMI